MKLTKLQRHTAYIILLAEAEKKMKRRNYGDGFCILIGTTFNRGTILFVNSYISITDLKELYLREPDEYYNYYGYWFPQTKEGWQKRIEILKQCIIETA